MDPYVYDQAKYHFESCEEAALPMEQAYVHTGLFFGWLIEHDLLDAEFIEAWELAPEIALFRSKDLTGPKLFELVDGALIDDMLTDEGNRFAQGAAQICGGNVLQF